MAFRAIISAVLAAIIVMGWHGQLGMYGPGWRFICIIVAIALAACAYGARVVLRELRSQDTFAAYLEQPKPDGDLVTESQDDD